MPPREDLLRERLVKEAAHELGHTFGLRHCADWRCVMASSHARGAAGRKGRGVLRRVPETGLPERLLVAEYYRRPRPSTFFIGENPVAPLNSSLAATALKIPFHLYRKGT